MDADPLPALPLPVLAPHRRATVSHCLVRLGDPAAALRPCGDRPALAWTLRELQRFGVSDLLLLPGHPAPAALDRIGTFLPRPARITVLDTEAGPLGVALAHLPGLGERVLLCDGAIMFTGNLGKLLAAGAACGSDQPGFRLMLQSAAGLADSGIRLVRRETADDDSALTFVTSEGRLLSPDRPPALPRRALFLDRDGVLNIDHGYVGCRDRFEWVDGALDAIRHATAAGWHVFIVTNQSGVARGLYDEAAVRDLLDWIADEARAAGGTIDDTRFCPFHPEARVEAYRQNHPWRKPAPDMLLDLIRVWDIDPGRSVMVGDQASDMAAATASGVRGCLFPGGNLHSFIAPVLDAAG